MRSRGGWGVVAVAAAIAAAAASCSVHNLDYGMVVRDLDAVVEVEGAGPDQRLSYRTEVTATARIAQWTIFLPIRGLLLGVFGERVDRELQNPSLYVRELLQVLAEKVGDDPLRSAEATQRLVRVAVLDPSPLNRIVALDGLVALARELEFGLWAGIPERGVRLEPPPLGAEALNDFAALRPAAREPIGVALAEAEAHRYEAAMARLTERPLPHWSQRLALLADLANAVRDEREPTLRRAAEASMRRALHHAVQWTVVEALAGREPSLVEVRMRALELMHRDGGPDSVALLLALLAASPDRIAAGEPMFEDHEAVRLRLVHFCGQLDPGRATRAAVLPGRETWQRIAPAELLARFALDGDPYFSPIAMPAREALAHCLRRAHARPAEDLDGSKPDWVREWYGEFQRQKGKP